MLFQIYFIDSFSFVIELNCYLNWLEIRKNNKIRLQDSFSFILEIWVDTFSSCILIYSEIKIYYCNEKLAFFVNKFKKRAKKRQILAQKETKRKKIRKKWLNCENNVLTEKGRIKLKKDQICILKFWLNIK